MSTHHHHPSMRHLSPNHEAPIAQRRDASCPPTRGTPRGSHPRQVQPSPIPVPVSRATGATSRGPSGRRRRAAPGRAGGRNADIPGMGQPTTATPSRASCQGHPSMGTLAGGTPARSPEQGHTVLGVPSQTPWHRVTQEHGAHHGHPSPCLCLGSSEGQGQATGQWHRSTQHPKAPAALRLPQPPALAGHWVIPALVRPPFGDWTPEAGGHGTGGTGPGWC